MTQFILLLFLLIPASSQILAALPTTLANISHSASSLDSLQARAILYLFEVHPELSNYTLTNITSDINRTNQTYAANLRDFLFELTSGNTTFRALVSLSNVTKQNYVAVSPVVESQAPPKSSLGQSVYWMVARSGGKSDGWNSSSSKQQESTNKTESRSGNNSSGGKKGALNTYTLYRDYNDSLVQFAFDYVASLHPNIINYDIQNVYYQIVAGLNIRINYTGQDAYSVISAVVNFDLKLTPSLLAFEVDCANHDDFCTPLACWNIYQSIESILVFHPELFAYRIANLTVQNKIVPGGSIRVLTAFQNSVKGLRSQMLLEIGQSKATLIYFYTFSTEQ